ncbi:protein kinase, putative [Trichophyton verrucosum HKI 0517]|uniref:non-specific serine/threonine protein kinase n=1 Tax=Trichophyton verrucosum (strain HKI 0517) TaxID=663202 RepID=D4DIZ4_TRIVH|nr:protein kinase, putative [Trichophyton verrucosum HKI 0517]EFE38193.1 protein kinase, putative [Trichophyton verrucosum HKI 0517]
MINTLHLTRLSAYSRPITWQLPVYPATRTRRFLWTSISSSLKSFLPKLPERRRLFPTNGFQVVDSNIAIEEEAIPDYKADRFYPVKLGEVFEGRFQVIAKLGFGSSSTIWLARDLRHVSPHSLCLKYLAVITLSNCCRRHEYVALKVYMHTSKYLREPPFYDHISRHLTNTKSQYERQNIRRVLSTFQLAGPHGIHPVLVCEASQMSLRDMKTVFFPNGFEESFVKAATIELLKAVEFSSTPAQGSFTPVYIHPGNLLLGLYDNNVLQVLEKMEFDSPVPRKPVSDSRTIYMSRLGKPKEGPMLLSDFGEARIGPGPHGGDIMPLEFRAPEVLLYVGWSYPVDIWSVGLTRLFTARDEEDGQAYDAVHFAEMIAALGPPPAEFLAKNPERRADFWGEKGEWLELAPIPEGRTLESVENRLENNEKFLKFIRRALTWMPEERPTAKELMQDPWLTS